MLLGLRHPFPLPGELGGTDPDRITQRRPLQPAVIFRPKRAVIRKLVAAICPPHDQLWWGIHKTEYRSLEPPAIRLVTLLLDTLLIL